MNCGACPDIYTTARDVQPGTLRRASPARNPRHVCVSVTHVRLRTTVLQLATGSSVQHTTTSASTVADLQLVTSQETPLEADHNTTTCLKHGYRAVCM